MTTLKSQAQAREDALEAEKLRKRAARQAAKEIDNPKPVETVEVTILPHGDGKISMGIHIGGVGEAFYEEDEKLVVPQPVALDLYEKGYVNFPNARKLLEERNARRQAAARRALDRMDPDERDAIMPGSNT